MPRVRFTFVVLLALWLIPRPAAAAAITFQSATITGSDPFDVDIRIEDVDSLYSFVFDLLYDPLVVEVVGVKEGAFLGGPTMPPTTAFFPDATFSFPDDSGVLLIANTRVGALDGVSGSGSLALVTFRPLVTNGEAKIDFSSASFASISAPVPCTAEDLLCPGDAFAIDVDLRPGRIQIEQTTPVPEPASLTLFGLGLFGLARRFR